MRSIGFKIELWFDPLQRWPYQPGRSRSISYLWNITYGYSVMIDSRSPMRNGTYVDVGQVFSLKIWNSLRVNSLKCLYFAVNSDWWEIHVVLTFYVWTLEHTVRFVHEKWRIHLFRTIEYGKSLKFLKYNTCFFKITLTANLFFCFCVVNPEK